MKEITKDEYEALYDDCRALCEVFDGAIYDKNHLSYYVIFAINVKEADSYRDLYIIRKASDNELFAAADFIANFDKLNWSFFETDEHAEIVQLFTKSLGDKKIFA